MEQLNSALKVAADLKAGRATAEEVTPASLMKRGSRPKKRRKRMMKQSHAMRNSRNYDINAMLMK